MKTKISIAVLLMIIFASCSVSHILTDDANGPYYPTDKKTIEVFSTDKTDRNYVIIGEVFASAEEFNGAESSVKHLKREAAKMGADGIINLRLRVSEGTFGNAVQAKGTAIKYVNNNPF
jgi:hypothetical protein